MEKCFTARLPWNTTKEQKGVKRLSKASFISNRRESDPISDRGQVVLKNWTKQMLDKPVQYLYDFFLYE